jgi:hypothetical protein
MNGCTKDIMVEPTNVSRARYNWRFCSNLLDGGHNDGAAAETVAVAVTDTQMATAANVITAMVVIAPATPVAAETVHTDHFAPNREPRVGTDQLSRGEVCPSCGKDTENPRHGRARVRGRAGFPARPCPDAGG